MITIVNYGLGNLNSIANMISHLGGESRIITSPDQLKEKDKIILPGVGAFDHGMKGLRDGGWIERLDNCVLENDSLVLGICLGMQLLCKSSEEGNLPGLGWINAEVRRFERSKMNGLKVPHMGWNTVEVAKENSLITNLTTEQRYYFVHSYYAVCNDPRDILATSHYGHDFTAAVSHDNIFGVQFHPEKSHRFGMELFRNFIAA